ncbi:hypothetical protein DL897_01260 [Thermoflavimicrobium daqui]|uniref:Serine/threonine protein kinase n=1 Tax=Thermoflavimicrobium daqui TaxID=2137476 RepID=A0A364K8U9_9BACL|nr:hypothetical protein DL897_01260 [Thermoflavimicrobium daqui]
MVTVELPYDAEEVVTIIFKHLQEPVPDPRNIKPDLPRKLCEVIEKALAKDPTERFQSTEEMAHALNIVSTFNQAEESLPEDTNSIVPKVDNKDSSSANKVVSKSTNFKVIWLVGICLLIVVVVGLMFYEKEIFNKPEEPTYKVLSPYLDEEDQTVLEEVKTAQKQMKGIHLKSTINLNGKENQEEIQFVDEKNFYYKYNDIETFQNKWECVGRFPKANDKRWYKLYSCHVQMGLQDPKEVLALIDQSKTAKVEKKENEYMVTFTLDQLNPLQKHLQMFAKNKGDNELISGSFEAQIWTQTTNHRVKKIEQTIKTQSSKLNMTTHVLGEMEEIKRPN